LIVDELAKRRERKDEAERRYELFDDVIVALDAAAGEADDSDSPERAWRIRSVLIPFIEVERGE
jgi:hypothetical protein